MWLITISLVTLAISAFGNAASLQDTDALEKLLVDLERKRSADDIENDILAKGCEGQPAEIVFIIDDSRSIYAPDFKKQIEFVGDIVKIFNIGPGPDDVRVGAVTFGDGIIMKNTFGLSTYSEEKSLENGIKNIIFAPEEGGSTQTAEAISYTRKSVFNEARSGVDKIAIVLTDGASTYGHKTLAEAALARNDGILMIAIGVGGKVSLEELKGIASGGEYVFTVDTFDALQQIKIELGMKACRVPTTTTSTTTTTTTTTPLPTTTTTPEPTTTPVQMDQPCDKDIDVNFVFDSGMMGVSGTNDVIKFIKSSITDQNLDKSNIKFGTVAGPCNKVFGFKLNTYESKEDISNHFDQFHETVLAPLVGKSYKEAFKIEHGGRPEARKVVVIFLKGKLKDPIKVIDEAKLAREKGIEVYVVNMDNLNSQAMLESIVSPKEADHILSGVGVDMLALSGEFSHRLCTNVNPQPVTPDGQGKKPDCP